MIRKNLDFIINYGKYFFSGQESQKVFVVGTGRSGTNFMARILNSHPDITDLSGGKENGYVFLDVANRALHGKDIGVFTLAKYRALSRAAYPKIFSDQSHPNIWNIEILIQCFPDIKFIGMVRCPFSVVYSSMNHSGVKGWLVNYERYPAPNKFLGINDASFSSYANLTIAQRGALRWCAHMKRMDEVKRLFPDKVLLVRYEDLCCYPADVLGSVKDFLSLDSDFSLPDVNRSSLHKKSSLSEVDFRAVYEIVKHYFDEEKLKDNENVPLDSYLCPPVYSDNS